MTTIAIDQIIWANIVKRGMVIQTTTGQRIGVANIRENHDTFTYTDLNGQTATVPYSDQVCMKGYFNLEG